MDQIAIARIQDKSDESMRLSAVLIGDLGGDDAAYAYLNRHIHSTLGVVIRAFGPARARQLMGEVLITAEVITHQDTR